MLPRTACLDFCLPIKVRNSGSFGTSSKPGKHRIAVRAALDRFIPQLHNYHTQGRTWKEHGITADRVLERNACIADGSAPCGSGRTLLNDAVEKGFLPYPERKLQRRIASVLCFFGLLQQRISRCCFMDLGASCLVSES